MNTVVTFVDAIPARGVALDGAFGWLLIVFAGFCVGVIVGAAMASLRERTALRVVRCPRHGVRANVAIGRGAARPVVQRCSLLSPPADVACGGGCVAASDVAPG
ncbi:MAG: hypothetical protein U0842_10985 [Candidatus Binatia bacterium]